MIRWCMGVLLSQESWEGFKVKYIRYHERFFFFKVEIDFRELMKKKVEKDLGERGFDITCFME